MAAIAGTLRLQALCSSPRTLSHYSMISSQTPSPTLFSSSVAVARTIPFSLARNGGIRSAELALVARFVEVVRFAVNGTIILTFMWVLKAFLQAWQRLGPGDQPTRELLQEVFMSYGCQVICTLGSVVFVSILIIRGIWSGVSYLQENRSYRAYEDEPQSWNRSPPAAT